MFKKLTHNEDGVIFVTVLVIVIVTTLLAISIYSLNSSQAMLAEEEVRRIQSSLIAEGEHVRYIGSRFEGVGYTAGVYTISSFPFTVSPTVGAPGTGLNYSTTFSINVSF